MATGRELAVRALREPMVELGWRPRAAGWFTTAIAAGRTGVLAVGAAAEHAAPGTAQVTLHVHLRCEDVQPPVRELTGDTTPDGGYRSTTAVTSIGYLMPEPTWRTWSVTPSSAAAVAAELAAATRDAARPWLERLSADPGLLIGAVSASPAMTSAAGPCTVAVLLPRLGRPDEGWAFMAERLARLGDRTDPAADHLRRTADRLRGWLDELPTPGEPDPRDPCLTSGNCRTPRLAWGRVRERGVHGGGGGQAAFAGARAAVAVGTG